MPSALTAPVSPAHNCYWQDERLPYLMLLVYAKNEQENLTSNQVRSLRRAVQEEFK
jgi:hypothetical protein